MELVFLPMVDVLYVYVHASALCFNSLISTHTFWKALTVSVDRSAETECSYSGITNRRFPEITGEDNLIVFSYSGIVKSPEWRQQLRRADMQQF